MTTQELMRWLLERQIVDGVSDEQIMEAAIFIEAMYSTELKIKPNEVMNRVIHMMARITVAKLNE